ncbi:NEDD8-specific protease 1 [Brachypodium distachyon]|uniref:Ubiquitin-like protease family profile domain-containing protein n=1 Tax=Brachypodium distachyon TaxID=15368 RepID=I1IVA9_BRADI|nr:NEDD8-specific protease 1 [Brachypodium distachyon]KQJ92685.1 hypothetical protein BRADI_4g45245v3 [Brachypodium distachyon]|eukprot:XP_024311124.1 NEDD8-specific protease 1 [Brachypodium distachyon]
MDERVLSYGDVVLLRSDLAILRGPHFLNDRIIAFYLAHLSASFHGDGDLLLLPPSIPYLLSNLPDPESVAEPLCLASRRLVLLPVNDNPDASVANGGSHWTLLVLDAATTDPQAPRFVHHDSLRGSANAAAARRLARALTAGGAPLRFVEAPTPTQRNGHDCGVYVLAVARAICGWWRSSRRRENQQGGGGDWFATMMEEVDAESVGAMRAELLQLIHRLIQDKEQEEEKKSKAGVEDTCGQ